MKKTKNNKTLPKITLILEKDSKKTYLYRSVRKTQFFIKNKAKAYLKNDDLITIRVSYPDGSQNSGTYNNIGELTWALEAFVKDYV